MKCEFCGGELSLEDAFCRHCGRENKEAKKHVSQMKQYEGEFRQTQEEVYRASKKYGEVTARVIIIAVLLVALIVLLIMQANVYHWQRTFGNKKAEKNFAEYSAIIEGYLEDEDYLSLSSFVEANYIPTYDSKFEKYQPIFRVVQAYDYLYSRIARVQELGPNVENKEIEYLGDSLDSFYSAMNLDMYSYIKDLDVEKTRKAYENLEEYVAALMQSCFGFTAEEVQELREMSKSKRVVLIEEHIRNEAE